MNPVPKSYDAKPSLGLYKAIGQIALYTFIAVNMHKVTVGGSGRMQLPIGMVFNQIDSIATPNGRRTLVRTSLPKKKVFIYHTNK